MEAGCGARTVRLRAIKDRKVVKDKHRGTLIKEKV